MHSLILTFNKQVIRTGVSVDRLATN